MIRPRHAPQWFRLAALAVLTVFAHAHAQGIPEVNVILVDGEMCENWPDPGVIAFRRAGTEGDLAVNFALTGNAKRDIDYTAPAGDVFTIPDGRREAFVSNGVSA